MTTVNKLSPVSIISLMGFVVKVTVFLERFVYEYFRCLINIIPLMLHPSSSLILLLPEKKIYKFHVQYTQIYHQLGALCNELVVNLCTLDCCTENVEHQCTMLHNF